MIIGLPDTGAWKLRGLKKRLWFCPPSFDKSAVHEAMGYVQRVALEPCHAYVHLFIDILYKSAPQDP